MLLDSPFTLIIYLEDEVDFKIILINHIRVHDFIKESVQILRYNFERDLGGGYTARKDKPGEKGQYHIHVKKRGKEIFSMNQDGTAHDRSHNYQIPDIVAEAIAKWYPNFVLPKDNFIELYVCGSKTFTYPIKDISISSFEDNSHLKHENSILNLALQYAISKI